MSRRSVQPASVPDDVARTLAKTITDEMKQLHSLDDGQVLKMFRAIVAEITPTYSGKTRARYESLTSHRAKQLLLDLRRSSEMTKIKKDPVDSDFGSYLDRFMGVFVRVLQLTCHPSAHLVWTGGSVTDEVVAVSVATIAARRRGFVDSDRETLSSAILAYLKAQRFDLARKGSKLLSALVDHASMQRLYEQGDVPDFKEYTREFVAALEEVCLNTCLPFAEYILPPEHDALRTHASPLQIAVTLSDAAAKRHGFTEVQRLKIQKAIMAHLFQMDNGVPSIYYHAQHGQRGGNLLRLMRAHEGPKKLDREMERSEGKMNFDAYFDKFMIAYTRVARDDWVRDKTIDDEYVRQQAVLASKYDENDTAELLRRQEATDKYNRIKQELQANIYAFEPEPEPTEEQVELKKAADRKKIKKERKAAKDEEQTNDTTKRLVKKERRN